jgi:transcriptional regulator with XRE-family HTH domain
MRAPDFAAIVAGLTDHGLTQAELARCLHLDRSTVYRIACGDIRQPSFETGSKLLHLQAKSLKSLLHTRNTDGVMK